MQKKLPIGIENFEEFSTEGFYYVDKTLLIKELLNHWGKVNLFTRPRRFGKSLNMSMLKCFFEINHHPERFDGLKIMQEKELCDQYMGKFPVISISLKNVDGLSYEGASLALRNVIGDEAMRFQFLLDSKNLSRPDKEAYRRLIKVGKDTQGVYDMTEEVAIAGMKTLSRLLYQHYKQKVILLIDEYDVPLDKAFQYGYYDQMMTLIRLVLSQALKTNDCLYFAVLTGCLRISKESIFTGLNNLKVDTISDFRYNECFGFTDHDVDEILAYYHLSSYKAAFQSWYDGYRFGNVSVYLSLGMSSTIVMNYWQIQWLRQRITGQIQVGTISLCDCLVRLIKQPKKKWKHCLMGNVSLNTSARSWFIETLMKALRTSGVFSIAPGI